LDGSGSLPTTVEADQVFSSVVAEIVSLGAAGVMTSKFIGPAFHLVRTLDMVIDHGFRKLQIQVQIFQDPIHITRFRYRVWGLESFQLQPGYSAVPLDHEILTTMCLPNFGAGDYFEVEDINAAEQRFYHDFEAEFERRRDA
jgi:hypothetical protein